jgi:hypothetical protein
MSIFEVQTIELAPQGSKRPLKRLKQALGMVWPPNSAKPFRPRRQEMTVAAARSFWREPRVYWRAGQRRRS